MNILFFASSNRTYTALKNVYSESCKRGINSFFLYSLKNDPQMPSTNLDEFKYDSNVKIDFNQGHPIETLGRLPLPFIPDILLIARERWQPEQSILHELKAKFNTKVFSIEVSSPIINNIENRLEYYSRAYNEPQKFIDGFFEHSEFLKQRKIDCLYPAWGEKSIVTGNPRFDSLPEINKDFYFKKYNLNPNKKQILFWGIINTTRNTSLKLLKQLQNDKGDEFEILYKPNPQEPSNPLFHHQFNPFIIDGVKVVYDDEDINGISQICDIHIGSVSSIFWYSIFYSKKFISLDNVCEFYKHSNDLSTYFNETKNGVEDSAKFWMRVFNIPTPAEFIDLIELERLEIFNQTNKQTMDLILNHLNLWDDSYNFLYEDKKSYDPIIELFDDFNDQQASKRIINYLQENYEN